MWELGFAETELLVRAFLPCLSIFQCMYDSRLPLWLQLARLYSQLWLLSWWTEFQKYILGSRLLIPGFPLVLSDAFGWCVRKWSWAWHLWVSLILAALFLWSMIYVNISILILHIYALLLLYDGCPWLLCTCCILIHIYTCDQWRPDELIVSEVAGFR